MNTLRSHIPRAGHAACRVIVLTFLASFLSQTAIGASVPQQWAGGGGDFVFPDLVEFSSDPDERSNLLGGQGPADPGQELFAVIDSFSGLLYSDHPLDAIDVFPGVESGTTASLQVDAMAAEWDAYFDELRDNHFGTHLLISVSGDPGAPRIAIFIEKNGGSIGPPYIIAPPYSQFHLNAASAPDDLEELDAMEFWGPYFFDGSPPFTTDATYFSLKGDSSDSVHRFSAGSITPFLSRAVIHSALVSLGFTGTAGEVDVDALMVKDQGAAGVWDSGDAVLFSIRAAANFDGGEIVHLGNGVAASFLVHGGHAWDTAFSVSTQFGISTEEVDAIEGYQYIPGLPAP